MPSSRDITRLLRSIDEASAKFSGKLPAIERRMLEEVLLLTRSLEVKNGKVLSSMANLKLISSIRGKLDKLVLSKEYIKDVAELARSFSAIAAMQQAYFASAFNGFKPQRYYNALRDTAIANTVEALTEGGIRANVLKPINDLLRAGVTSGMSYAQMEQRLRAVLTEADGGSGALSRYAKTYAVDSMAQFAGEYMAAVTADLKTDWFVYRGSNIETTREFCLHLTKKEYVHRSEIPEILKGHIDGHQCKIYERTGLPHGMKEGTTPENFQANRGGWNCQHQLVPVAESQVPMELRKKFAPEIVAQREKYNGYGSAYEKVLFDDKTGGYVVKHKGHKFDPDTGKYELQTARMLALEGRAVEMMDERGFGKQYDIKVDGIPSEIKIMSGFRNIHARAEKAAAQGAKRIIYYIKFDNEWEMRNRFNNVYKTVKNINEIWYIKDGELNFYAPK